MSRTPQSRCLLSVLFRRGRRACAALLLGVALAGCGTDVEVGGPAAGMHRLSVAASGNGSVTSQPAGIQCGPNCTADFADGTRVTLTALPGTGQLFRGWGGECAGSSATCNVTMSANRTVTAVFVPVPPTSVTLTTSVTGGGTLRSTPPGIDCGSTCEASYAVDTVVMLTPTPDLGQVFSGWGGACAGAGLSCSVTMSAARSVSASFAPVAAVLRRLDITRNGNGTIRSQPVGIDCGSTCAASFNDGSSVTLTATPATGQRFTGWSGACAGSGATCTLSLTQDRSVVGNFAAAPAAAAWQTPMLLEASNDFDVANGALTAIASNGDALVMWEQSDGQPDGSARKVWSRRYVAGQGWTTAVAVPGLAGPASYLASGRLFIDGNGVATWIRPNLETRRYTPSAGWSAPFAPPARAAGLLTGAAIDAGGTIRVITSGADVYSIVLPAGTNAWGSWTRIDNGGDLDSRDADLAVSADGSAMSVWRERNPGDSRFSLKAARFLPASGWQTPQVLDSSTDNVSPETPPHVVMDASGNALAVWHQGDSLYTALYGTTGGWSPATEVDTNAVESSFTAQIRVSMTAAGRAVVLWRSGIYALKAMQYAPGTGFTAPVQVNSYGIDPQLGQDADGNAVVVYLAPDRWPAPTTGSDLYARRLVWGEGWSAATPIEPLDGLGAAVNGAFNRDGKAVAAWVRGDTAGSGARRSLWVNLLR
ncbi:InlB B-repeat-containing protein [Derxia gummosa]|uniref:InlB B-repeat-containing protein n=1 Tax=Derxia gummosa DSM 723 TaxID=1121388 RepID=A0A8B6X2A9_9BURK|nr:hypothetical protein [Derxia gummosa]